MNGWINRFMGAAVFVATLAFVPHAYVLAQATGPRADFEFQRMAEVVQEARDYVQRRRELLGGLPADVQPLVTQGQDLLQQLRQAATARDLPRTRRLFRQALGLFNEIRVRLNDAMDAQDPAVNTPEQRAARLERAVSSLRSRLDELQVAAGANPPANVASELTRIDGLVRALETPPSGTTPAALREQVIAARNAIRALAPTVAELTEVSP